MYQIYRVQRGETLSSIAKKQNTTVEELRGLNGFPPNYEVKENEQIIVPQNESNVFDLYVVQKGDNISIIARKLGVSAADLLRLNGMKADDYIYPGEELLVPNQQVAFYITEPDDTLTGVANRLKTTKEALVEQNKTIYLLPDQLIFVNKESQI